VTEESDPEEELLEEDDDECALFFGLDIFFEESYCLDIG